ncbi:enoyl-CoA hydratase/isomerase family protein [Vibrio astriarenae]|uniref:enoyl-CoA hydratase/isomerase family protein n=1 Tax=Vibrio astriarenae TaxID=1481923 RepID=UPI003735B01A
MDNQWVQYHQDDRVGVITLNRAKANAYDLNFVIQFGEALVEAEADTQVNAVVIKSGVDRFFCAGADINAFQQNSTKDNQKMVDQARRNMAAIEASNKIYIAQISGHTLGGGLEIAMACDLRFAAKGGYWFGLPEIKLGLIPGNGGTQRLVRLVGLSRALELLATGDSFTPEQAASWGVVNRLYEEEELNEQTHVYARTLSQGAGLAIAATKKALRQGVELSLADGLKREQELVDDLYNTHDGQEGFNAFVEKRDPEFLGK